MLKELVDIWKHRGIMIKAVDLFGEMLEDTHYVFQRSWEVFVGNLGFEEEKANIKARDKEVNSKERQIRKLLVEHLTINPSMDASGCLALMSMVKDAERIGDYSKNIFDLVIMVNGVIGELRYMELFIKIQIEIEKSLGALKPTFINSDEKAAKNIIARYMEIKKDCNKILHEIFSLDMPKQEALITVLLARYLKRINSHISNVASGIIFPLPQIDFVKGGLLE